MGNEQLPIHPSQYSADLSDVLGEVEYMPPSTKALPLLFAGATSPTVDNPQQKRIETALDMFCAAHLQSKPHVNWTSRSKQFSTVTMEHVAEIPEADQTSVITAALPWHGDPGAPALAILPRGEVTSENTDVCDLLGAFRAIRLACRRLNTGDAAQDTTRIHVRIASQRLGHAAAALRSKLPASAGFAELRYEAILATAERMRDVKAWAGASQAVQSLQRLVYSLVIGDTLYMYAPFAEAKHVARLGGPIRWIARNAEPTSVALDATKPAQQHIHHAKRASTAPPTAGDAPSHLQSPKAVPEHHAAQQYVHVFRPLLDLTTRQYLARTLADIPSHSPPTPSDRATPVPGPPSVGPGSGLGGSIDPDAQRISDKVMRRFSSKVLGGAQTVIRRLLNQLVQRGCAAASYILPAEILRYEDALRQSDRFTLSSLLPTFLRARPPSQPAPAYAPALLLVCNPVAQMFPWEDMLSASKVAVYGVPRADVTFALCHGSPASSLAARGMPGSVFTFPSTTPGPRPSALDSIQTGSTTAAALPTTMERAPSDGAAGALWNEPRTDEGSAGVGTTGLSADTAITAAITLPEVQIVSEKLKVRVFISRGASLHALIACPPPPQTGSLPTIIVPSSQPGNQKHLKELTATENLRKNYMYAGWLRTLDPALPKVALPSTVATDSPLLAVLAGEKVSAAEERAAAAGLVPGIAAKPETLSPIVAVATTELRASVKVDTDPALREYLECCATVERQLLNLGITATTGSTNTVLAPAAVDLCRLIQIEMPTVSANTAEGGDASGGHVPLPLNKPRTWWYRSTTVDAAASQVRPSMIYEGPKLPIVQASIQRALLAYAECVVRDTHRRDAFFVPDDWMARRIIYGQQPFFHNAVASANKTFSSLKSRYPGLSFHEIAPLVNKPWQLIAWLNGSAAGVGDLSTLQIHRHIRTESKQLEETNLAALSRSVPEPDLLSRISPEALSYPYLPSECGVGDVMQLQATLGFGAYSATTSTVWQVLLLQKADMLENSEIFVRLRFLLPHVTILLIPGPASTTKVAAKFLCELYKEAQRSVETLRKKSRHASIASTPSFPPAAPSTPVSADEYAAWFGRMLTLSLLSGRDPYSGGAVPTTIAAAEHQQQQHHHATVHRPELVSPARFLQTAVARLQESYGISATVMNPPPL